MKQAPVTLALIAAMLLAYPVPVEIGAISAGADSQPWRLFTAPFLHANIAHLLFNVWALLQLGTLFERLSGSAAMLLVYALSALASSLASLVFLHPETYSVGASGAIFGVAGALIATQPGGATWSTMLRAQIAFWSVVTVLLGFIAPGIDNAAHVGGFAMGLGTGAVLRVIPKLYRPSSRG